MLKSIIAVAVLSCASVAAAQAPAQSTQAQVQKPSLPAGDVGAKEIKAFIDALPKDAISDKAIRGFDAGSQRVTVYGVFRPKALPGDAILHETRTAETYYILEGTGVLVTGGVLADMIQVAPDAANQGPRARRIDGGVSRKVGPGDVIVIPGRTPHWWSSLDGDIRYMIIRSAPATTGR